MPRANTINPAILIWARESSGLSLEEAAKALALTDSERASATDKLAALERGDVSPTHPQLLRISSVYRRPLVAFYLNAPPRKGDRGEDFRTLQVDVSQRDNALLDAVLRDIRARQQIVRAALEEAEEAETLRFVGSARVSEGIAAVVTAIRGVLGVTLESQRGANSPESLFSTLRAAAERRGIFVLLLGNAGSHHTALSEKVFRGFALSDEVAPFVVINDHDAVGARSFTLIHELAHIWLGLTGVSGSLEETLAASAAERFCNDVAGEFLLPAAEISKAVSAPLTTVDEVLEVAKSLADRWKVSQSMAAYRLNRFGSVSSQLWRNVAAVLAQRWTAYQTRAKELARENEGGPSYYVVRRSKLGKALVDVVERALRTENLSHTKAAKVLGVKPTNVDTLLRQRSGVA